MYSGRVQLWDMSSGEILLNICAFSEEVSLIKAINKELFAMSSKSNLMLWNLTTGVHQNLIGHTADVLAIEYFSNGYLVSILFLFCFLFLK